MARIAEESEDEFPDLVDLLKPAKAASCKKPTSTTTSTATKSTSNWKGPSRGKHELGERCRSNDGKEGTGINTGIKKTKKRVLKQTSDNPLLRPIANSSISVKASEVFEMAPKSKSNSSRPRKVIESRKPDPADWDFEEDLEQAADDEGMSNFVVDDSELLDEDDSVIEMPPPRSTRKLVRGRRQTVEDSEDEELGLKMEKLTVRDEDLWNQLKATGKGEMEGKKKHAPEAGRRKKTFRKELQTAKELSGQKPLEMSSDLENPFILRL